MARMREQTPLDREILEIALGAYEQRLAEVSTRIDQIRRDLGELSHITPDGSPAKRAVSPEARARMKAAQQRRWALIKAQSEGDSRPKRRRG